MQSQVRRWLCMPPFWLPLQISKTPKPKQRSSSEINFFPKNKRLLKASRVAKPHRFLRLSHKSHLRSKSLQPTRLPLQSPLKKTKSLAMPPGIVTNGVILRALGGNMRKFERRQRHSLPFGLFVAAVAALLLPAALAPRANAGSTDYWDSEYPLGPRPRPAPELFSQPQGVPINQP